MLKLLLSEHIFISLCGAAFFVSGSQLINHEIPPIPLISTIFWSTLLIYQVNSRTRFNLLSKSSYKDLNFKADRILISYLVILLILCMHVLLLDLPIAIYLLHLGIVSTMYNVPRKSNGIVKFPLRSIPFLKILLIAYVWASLFAILPIIISSNDQKLSDTLFMFAAHFLFIVSITLPFDIRDFKTDHENLLTTIPHVVGIKLAKALSLLCLTIFYIMMLPSLEPIYLTVLYLITAGLIIFSSSRRKNYYFTLFIDGTIILYYIAIQLSG